MMANPSKCVNEGLYYPIPIEDISPKETYTLW